MGVRPIRDKILIKRIDVAETTKGGIIIPDTAAEKPKEGEVVAVGSGMLMPDGSVKPLEVKAGERVLFGQYGGTEISLEGEDYIILDANGVLAVIES